jgi:hypothetical protein
MGGRCRGPEGVWRYVEGLYTDEGIGVVGAELDAVCDIVEPTGRSV